MVTAKKKPVKKSPRPRKKIKKGILFYALVGLAVVLSGFVVFLLLNPEEVPVSPKSVGVSTVDPPITYEETGHLTDPATIEPPERESPVSPGGGDPVTSVDRPLVAIVIDDMGYNEKVCESLLALKLNLSFAFLPFGPYTAQQAARARRLGRDVLLHFPMEALDAKFQPGVGTVTIAMGSADIRRIFAENLAAVPYAVGVNNHMGSRFTQNNPAMRDFMGPMLETGLFFLDSRTSQNSIGYSLAKELGVRAAKRDIFLDNVRDPKKIIIQLTKLLAVARRHGSAIAIGHPYPETLAALKEYNREISRQAKVVGIAALVK